MSTCGDLPKASDIVPTLVILIRCSTNNSLHSYIRSMPVQVVVPYFFYFLIFTLFLEVALMSVSTIHILKSLP